MQRADLALRLVESLDPTPDATASEVESAWATELTRRVAALADGSATTRPMEDAVSDAHAWLAQRRVG